MVNFTKSENYHTGKGVWCKVLGGFRDKNVRSYLITFRKGGMRIKKYNMLFCLF